MTAKHQPTERAVANMLLALGVVAWLSAAILASCAPDSLTGEQLAFDVGPGYTAGIAGEA